MNFPPGSKVTLLTGGTGFLGSHLLRRLAVEGFHVVIVKRTTSDLSRIRTLMGAFDSWNLDTTDVAEVFERYKVDRVIHCATNYGRNEQAPWETIEANLVLPLKLIHLASRAGVASFVNTDTILNKRISHYSLSKRQFIDWMNSYSSDLLCLNIALEHFYGPEDDPSKFVTRILLDLLEEKSSIPLTPGDQRRDFIYVDDVIDGFMRILAVHDGNSKGYHHYEIGTGSSVSIRDFVQLAKRLTGNEHSDLEFGVLPYRANEVMNSAVDTTRLRALGWSPRFSLEEGLKRTLELQGYRGGRCVT